MAAKNRSRRVRGNCDYCGKRRMIGKRTQFCRECEGDIQYTVEKYFDDDPFAPMRAVEELWKKSTKK